MKKVTRVVGMGFVIATVVAIGTVSAYAGLWYASVVPVDITVTPAPCVPQTCPPRVRVPACPPPVCGLTERPCFPSRIGYWTGPARLGGQPTYNEYSTITGGHSQIVDVGLNAVGRPAHVFQNSAGGTTVMKYIAR